MHHAGIEPGISTILLRKLKLRRLFPVKKGTIHMPTTSEMTSNISNQFHVSRTHTRIPSARRRTTSSVAKMTRKMEFIANQKELSSLTSRSVSRPTETEFNNTIEEKNILTLLDSPVREDSCATSRLHRETFILGCSSPDSDDPTDGALSDSGAGRTEVNRSDRRGTVELRVVMILTWKDIFGYP